MNKLSLPTSGEKSVVKSEAEPKVVAVVVTYNRRGKLARCIGSIREQSRPADQILVVDNASTDGTAEVLAELAQQEPKLTVIQMSTNTGGAGGFHKGIREGVLAGADFLWVMDDDCYPREKALERLLHAFAAYERRWGEPPGFTCSRVLAGDESSICEMNIPGAAWNWNFPYTDELFAVAVHWCSFVSCLIRADDVKQKGLPLKEYFIWYDDVEYTRRLAWGKCGLAVMDSIAVHDMPANDPVDWNKVTWDNLWKYRYGLRNQAAWHYCNEGRRSYLRYIRFVWQRSGMGPASLKLRLALMKWGLKALTFRPQPDFIGPHEVKEEPLDSIRRETEA